MTADKKSVDFFRQALSAINMVEAPITYQDYINKEATTEAVDKSALKAWYDKYSKYEGNNGDKLPNGMFLGYTDTGILTDGVEINEFTNLVNKHFGGDRDEAEDKVFSDEIMYKFLPITHAMREEFFKIMGDLDEDTCRKAVQILGEDIVGFALEDL